MKTPTAGPKYRDYGEKYYNQQNHCLKHVSTALPQMSLKYLVQFPALKRPSHQCCMPRNKLQRTIPYISLETQAKVNYQCPSTENSLEE